MAEICGEVMGLEEVWAGDNFFDLGGHSRMATKIISSVRECFQTGLTLRQVFASPTVAGLAREKLNYF
ncbi:MAG TPA: phosphopantetheine-binding protein [Pyrinomonadaceae bacterium]